MRLESNTTYHMDYDIDAFRELVDAPDAYAARVFNLSLMPLCHTTYTGWYVCVLRRLGDRYVFIPLFNSMKDAFLLNAEPIEMCFVSEFTLYDDFMTNIDPECSLVKAYNLPISVINSFNARTTKTDGNTIVSVRCEGADQKLIFTQSLAVEYR